MNQQVGGLYVQSQVSQQRRDPPHCMRLRALLMDESHTSRKPRDMGHPKLESPGTWSDVGHPSGLPPTLSQNARKGWGTLG
jgi:hypothetical protein